MATALDKDSWVSHRDRQPTTNGAAAAPCLVSKAMSTQLEPKDLAIQLAEKSIPEDAGIHPLVGAVLERDGKIVESAYRGEISAGDHAEYILLERKLLNQDVTGSTLYTTLEPCTESESSLMQCVNRIIRRRIKKVVIGMLDPNPKIRGEGVMLLRDHNIEVEFFPSALMEKIEKINSDFIRKYRGNQEVDLNDLRRQGARIQVVSFILTRRPHHSILLGRSVYGGIWMPPQEGVNIKESLKEALARGLQEECGIKNSIIGQTLYARTIKYLGSLELPEGRKGERLVADNATGTEFESVTLKSKAYWQAILLVASQDELRPSPNQREITELKWFTLEDAKAEIEKSNHPDKAKLLISGLVDCERALQGVLPPKSS